VTDHQRVALEAVRKTLKQNASGFVEVESGNGRVDYQIGISKEGGVFEILDPQGKPFGDMRPALEADASKAEHMAKRLLHLNKYHSIQQLSNYDSLSRLSGKLQVDLFKIQEGYQLGDRPDPQPLVSTGGIPEVEEGDSLFLHIKNLSPQVLNIAALDLQPDWSVIQIYPPESRGDFLPIDAGREVWEVLQFSLPADYTEGVDIFKVFATVGPANFRWLELPPLDNAPRSHGARGLRAASRNPLEELLISINSEAAPTRRNLTPPVEASDEWTVTEVSVRVRKKE
jgi:hypothetical protein